MKKNVLHAIGLRTAGNAIHAARKRISMMKCTDAAEITASRNARNAEGRRRSATVLQPISAVKKYG